MDGLLIGQLSRHSGVNPRTIRYYEALGVLRPARRTAGGYRRYGSDAVSELRFVKRAQALGFSLDDIKQVLDLARAGRAPCATVLTLARAHLVDLDRRIEQLQRLRGQLGAAVFRWQDGGAPPDCASTLCGLINDAVDPAETGAPPRHGDSMIFGPAVIRTRAKPASRRASEY